LEQSQQNIIVAIAEKNYRHEQRLPIGETFLQVKKDAEIAPHDLDAYPGK